MKIYHNPRCSKSRQTLSIIIGKGIEVEIIEYLKKSLTFNELRLILVNLKIAPIHLVREKEEIWKEKGRNKDLTKNQIIKLMIDNPKIIERPIVTNGNLAIIGRPPENVLKIIS